MFVGFVFFNHFLDCIQFHEVDVRLDDVSIYSFAGLETILFSILCFYFGKTAEILSHTQSELKTIQIFVLRNRLTFCSCFLWRLKGKHPQSSWRALMCIVVVQSSNVSIFWQFRVSCKHSTFSEVIQQGISKVALIKLSTVLLVLWNEI